VGGVVWDCIEGIKSSRGHVVRLEPQKQDASVCKRAHAHAMPPTKQSTAIRQSITLKGSTDLVTEFFKYAVNTWVPSPVLLYLNEQFIGYCSSGECTPPMTFIWSKNMVKPC